MIQLNQLDHFTESLDFKPVQYSSTRKSFFASKLSNATGSSSNTSCFESYKLPDELLALFMVSLSSVKNKGVLLPSFGLFDVPGTSHSKGLAIMFPEMLLSTPICRLMLVFTIPGYAALTKIPLPVNKCRSYTLVNS